jgi:hypothetical protein
MRSHRPRARHGIPCERGYSGRAKRSRRNPHVCSSNFVEGETFEARLERGPLPQHDGMGLGPAIASGLTAYTAIRSSSNRFSQLASWFQLAKMRLTRFLRKLASLQAPVTRFTSTRNTAGVFRTRARHTGHVRGNPASVARLAPRIPPHTRPCATLKTHCAEVEKRRNVQVAFNAGDLGYLHPEIAVCFFRIAQELHRNGVIHMEERAHVVGGGVQIITGVGQGTTIRVRGPVEPTKPIRLPA